MLMKKIARWARQRIEQIPAAARFELWHCQEIGEPVALCKIQCGSGSAEDRAHEVASQFFDASDDHSKAFDSNQRYKIAAFDLSDDELAIYVFAAGNGISSPSVARAEVGEPTEKGLLAQLMRHNQQLAQINSEQSAAVNSALIAENRDLRGRVQKVEEQRHEWFELLETLHGQRHERELELAQAHAQAEQKSKAFRLLAQFAPEVVRKLTVAPKPAPAPALLAAQPSQLETAHEKMRSVWRILDREWLRGHLDADNLARVESLLGAGLPLANVEEFGSKLRELWESLPLDVSEELQAMIFSRDPGLASELVGFLPSANEAAE